MEGVWGPGRLIVLDRQSPYKIANGTVVEVFRTGDGDYHVHVNVEKEYVHLIKQSIFATSLPVYQIFKALSFAPIVVIVTYVVVSVLRPEKTYLGRLIRRRKED
jgi:hypothetical protein